ncbi:uncharacterized protein LOC115386693 [Salarias fasciatus]|uniref:uncharacterized protein LOC115386693 n=1 Tax=Salarias fasciatus TaxID=181472 RepID=UPI0011768FA9|nr:uncharacterized protein LOC115386693 [Salarias fasciatus]
MGRLDNVAKHKVVELRKAGLSFRKIKAVLELEDIKVSAQAIYLFLREFEGRPMVRVKPAETGSSTSSPQARTRPVRPAQENWSGIHLQNLRRETTSGFTAGSDFGDQTATNSEAASNSSGSAEISGSSRPEQQYKGNKDENDIQIVSVTSLAQQSQQRASQSTVARADTGSASSASALSSSALMRRRITPSPASTSMLAARKRLLDKALSQRIKVASLLRRDPTSVHEADLRSALHQPHETYDLTSEKTILEGQPGSGGAPRRFLTQRPGPSLRSPHSLPRVGIRLPGRPLPPMTTSAPGSAAMRLQTPGTQGVFRNEGNPSQQQAAQDTAMRSALPEQIKTLSSEMRSLGFAVKMLVEQQCRLEREQAQQTQIQKEILSTLQTLTSKVGCCSHVQQQHNKTPSPAALPAASASTSFSQDTFNFSQNDFAQCSQTQPSFNSLDSLDSVDAFKLPELGSTSMNGFPPCSNAESLPLTHTPPQTQAFAAPYSEPSSQALLSPYTQSYVSTYSQSLPGTFGVTDSKAADFHSSCTERTFQTSGASTQTAMSSSQDLQISNIKVEAP